MLHAMLPRRSLAILRKRCAIVVLNVNSAQFLPILLTAPCRNVPVWRPSEFATTLALVK